MSTLNLNFFTPCFLFVKMCRSFSPSMVAEMWPIPTFFMFFLLVAYIATKAGGRYAGFPSMVQRFVLVALAFNNSNSLPISLIQSIANSSGAEVLFKDADDTFEKVTSR